MLPSSARRWLILLFAMLSAFMSAESQARVDYDQPDHVMDRAELEALFDVMEALVNDTQWRKNHPRPCSFNPWPGIECQQLDDYMLHVTKIEVGSTAKSRCKQNATISPAIYKLAHLKAIVIMGCFVTSNTTIPPGLEKLAQSLEMLTLRGNSALTGSIPKELGNLKKLEVLSLSQNSLHGNVPPELGNLEKLQNLELSYNSLTGAIPQELGHITSLSILDLSNNQLQGHIPDSIGKLEQLKKMDLSNNQLAGLLPSSVGNLKMLQFLALNKNGFTGGIPSAIASLSNLQYLLLQDNPMHTPVPDFWGRLGKITELRLSNSGYTGTIPESICNLRNLSELTMDRNLLTGSIPVTLGNLPNIYHLNLSDNLLIGNVPFAASFCSRLGGNLDLHGNSGLCMTNAAAGSASTSDLKRCGKTSGSSSSSLQVPNPVFILLYVLYWKVTSSLSSS